MDQMNAFLEYAMTHENVFLVTVSQVGGLVSIGPGRMQVQALCMHACWPSHTQLHSHKPTCPLFCCFSTEVLEGMQNSVPASQHPPAHLPQTNPTVSPLQVLEWMQNPVPASQYSPTCPSEDELLKLLPQGTTLCVMPNEGCAYVSKIRPNPNQI